MHTCCLYRIDPSIQEGESIAGIASRVNTVIELIFQESVAVSVGCGVISYFRDGGCGTAVEVDDEVPVLWRSGSSAFVINGGW